MYGYGAGALEITGAGSAPGWAVQNAMRQVMAQPAFHQLVAKHATGQCSVDPASLAQYQNAWQAQAAMAAAAQAQAAAAPVPQPASQAGGGVAYGGQPALVDRPVRDFREFPLGFFQSGIGPGTGTVEVISRPQIIFRGERLVIPAVVGANFSLIDIKIGNRSQLVNSTALPAAVFAENAIGIRLSLDTAAVAQDIALSVQNTAATQQTFQAALIGTAAQ